MLKTSHFLKPLIQSYRRHYKRFKTQKSAVTAVEFALVAVPFFSIVFAIIETGLVFFGAIALENSVDQTSRMVRTGQAQSASMTEAQFRQNVCASINTLFDCQNNLKIELRSFPDFQTAGDYMDNIDNAPLNDEGELRDDFTFDANTEAGDIVLVRAYMEWDIVLNFPGSSLGNMPNGSRLLIATTTFKNEPF